MPGRSLHIAQAQRNRGVARHLLTRGDDASLQWAVVSAFYCALHCIEAHFADRGGPRGEHYFKHADREAAMADDSRSGIPIDVYTAYRALYERAYGARYEFWSFNAGAVQQLLDDHLARITRFARLT